MDEFANALAQAIVDTAANDSSAAYTYAMGMRYALELYMGVDDARSLLLSYGHEY